MLAGSTGQHIAMAGRLGAALHSARDALASFVADAPIVEWIN
jgi:hypothetical protein